VKERRKRGEREVKERRKRGEMEAKERRNGGEMEAKWRQKAKGRRKIGRGEEEKRERGLPDLGKFHCRCFGSKSVVAKLSVMRSIFCASPGSLNVFKYFLKHTYMLI
jgi:hypothetical protein